MIHRLIYSGFEAGWIITCTDLLYIQRKAIGLSGSGHERTLSLSMFNFNAVIKIKLSRGHHVTICISVVFVCVFMLHAYSLITFPNSTIMLLDYWVKFPN